VGKYVTFKKRKDEEESYHERLPHGIGSYPHEKVKKTQEKRQHVKTPKPAGGLQDERGEVTGGNCKLMNARCGSSRPSQWEKTCHKSFIPKEKG